MLRVMASNRDNPFADYLWMGEMDKFDSQVEEELEEEQFIKSCIEQLLEEEEERETVYFQQPEEQNGFYNNDPYGSHQQVPFEYIGNIANNMTSLHISNKSSYDNNKNYQISTKPIPKDEKEKIIPPEKSTLNPNATPFSFNPHAKEFIPNSVKAVSFNAQNGHEPQSSKLNDK